MNRSKMTAGERKRRSKLAKEVSFNEFIKGTIDMRAKKCMSNGKRYMTMYLLYMENGEQKQKYIPRKWEEKVKKWVENHKNIQRKIKGISDIYIKKITNRKK